MPSHGRHTSQAKKNGLDPAALVVAVVLIAGVIGIGFGVHVRNSAQSTPVDSPALLTASASQTGDAAGDGAPGANANEASSKVGSESAEESEVEPSEQAGAASVAQSEAEPQPEPFDAATYFSESHTNANGDPVYEPLIIGDSVAAGCIDQFNSAFPNGLTDAVVSRNVWESPYATYRDAGQVGKVVIFCLGTNNAVVDWQIDDELLNMVEDDKVVFFVNTRSNQEWTESTNAVLADIPSRHPNVAGVIDWYGYSAGHDEWFAGDGTHVGDEGAQAYVGLIYDSVVAYLNEHPLQ